MLIPMGTLGLYPVPGLVPGENAALPLGRHNFILSTATAAQPLTQFFKIHAGTEAAQADAGVARDDARRITANRAEASTANPSALKEAEGQLAEAEAGLFQAERERSTARAELERTVGRKQFLNN